MVMASAAAVASSSKEELDMGMPVRSHTMVWKFNKDSSLHSKRPNLQPWFEDAQVCQRVREPTMRALVKLRIL